MSKTEAKPIFKIFLFTCLLMMLSLNRDVSAAAYTSISDGVYLIQSGQNSNYVADIYGNSTSNCANITLYKKVGSVNQLFGIQYVKTINGIKYYRIINPYSLKVFDCEGASKRAGTNCIQYAWSGNDNQLWCFENAGSGYYFIKSKLGMYLDNSMLIVK